MIVCKICGVIAIIIIVSHIFIRKNWPHYMHSESQLVLFLAFLSFFFVVQTKKKKEMGWA